MIDSNTTILLPSSSSVENETYIETAIAERGIAFVNLKSIMVGYREAYLPSDVYRNTTIQIRMSARGWFTGCDVAR